MSLRSRQKTGHSELPQQQHRYSVASTGTSTTLVTCPCDSEPPTGSSIDAAGSNGCKAHRNGKDIDYEDDDDAASITSSALERRYSYPYRGMTDEEEDALDRLLRLSTSLLSVSRSILGNAKRLSVSESAWSQTGFGQEQEMQRTLESLETQERFLALMSRDAYAMSFPAGEGEQASAPQPLSVSRAEPLPVHDHHSSGSHLLRTAVSSSSRHRRSNISISSPAPRARTMYINAEAALPTAPHSATDVGGAPEPKKESRVRERASRGNFDSIAEEEADGLPPDSDETGFDMLPSPQRNSVTALSATVVRTRLLSPTSAETPSPATRFSSKASLDSLLAKNNSNATAVQRERERGSSPSPSSAMSISSPSSFFSSFFSSSSRSQASSAATSAAATPADAAAEMKRKKAASAPPPASPTPAGDTGQLGGARPSAQALLASLAAGARATEPSAVQQQPADSPFSTISQAYTAQSKLSGGSGGSQPREHSPSPSGPSPSALASAQLSLVHSASPHLTIADRTRARERTRTREAASASGEALPSPSASASAILQQKRPKHRLSLSESLLRASIGSAGAASGGPHRATGSVSVSRQSSSGGDEAWISRVPLNNSGAGLEGRTAPVVVRPHRETEVSAPA